MITLHNLKPAPKATQAKKRVGRGQGSGKGGTSTYGHKGAQSRRGYKRKIGFEGGQNPLIRRLPKLGKPNHIKKKIKIFDLETLAQSAQKANTHHITPEFLHAQGKIKQGEIYKILSPGKIKQPLHVTAHAFSTAAKKKIETLKGKAITL